MPVLAATNAAELGKMTNGIEANWKITRAHRGETRIY